MARRFKNYHTKRANKVFKSSKAFFSGVFFLLDPVVISAVVYAAIFALMSMGLTMTYVTTKVPNFSHGSIVTFGIYIAFSLFRLDRLSPYESAPVCFMIAGLIAVGVYLGVLRPLTRRGASIVSLMIATLALDIAFIGVIGIYSDYLFYNFRISDSKLFYAIDADFSVLGIPGLFFAAPATLVAVTLSLWALLTKTDLGIAMRAAVENPALARTVGVNVDVVYVVAWFIAGGLAGIAGAFYTLWLPGSPSVGTDLIVAIFAASILGGLTSIYGGAIGGVVVGAGEILITTEGGRVLGAWVLPYQSGIPLLLMVAALILMPGGIVSLARRHR